MFYCFKNVFSYMINTMRFSIIGFAGRTGVGKNYIAEMLRQLDSQSSMVLSFADQLKIQTMIKHHLSYEEVMVTKSRPTRRLLQLEGTERAREVYGKDVWCQYLEAWMTLISDRLGITRFYITDCRFQNEIDWIHEQGGRVVYVYAPRRHAQYILSQGYPEEVVMHVSEKELDGISNFDYFIDNDEEEPLSVQIHKLSEQLLLNPLYSFTSSSVSQPAT
jgi:phosphomevalonate kinase